MEKDHRHMYGMKIDSVRHKHMNNNVPVLVVVDIQLEYITPGRPFYLETAGSSIKNARRVLDHARKNRWEIINELKL